MEIDSNKYNQPNDDLVESGSTQPLPKKRITLIIVGLFLGILGIFLVAVFSFTYLNNPPSGFTPDSVVVIEPGSTAREITTLLKEKNIVTSETFLYLVLTLYFEPRDIKASMYVFSEPLTTFAVAEHLVTGEFGNDLIRFVHIEGERATHIAKQAQEQLIDFATLEFDIDLEIAKYLQTIHQACPAAQFQK
jgi:cell division protein YceG involved in septum cleavage